jgi:hypothetical protein
VQLNPAKRAAIGLATSSE